MQAALLDEDSPSGGVDFSERSWSMWGEIDLSVLSDVESEALKNVGDRTGELVIDVSRVTFMDSAGLHLLGRAATLARTVRLQGPTPAVREMLDLSGMSPLFQIDQTADQDPQRS